MMKVIERMLKFSTQQINNLINGTGLATEVVSTSDDKRAFIKIKAVYTTSFINTTDITKLRFWMRKYEIDKEYIENDWDVTDDELVNSVHIKGIEGLEKLEDTLANYLSDFSVLDVEWKCDNPL